MSENKRKLTRKGSDWFEPNFDLFNVSNKVAKNETQAENKTSNSKSQSYTAKRERNWIKILAPQTIQELAIHKNKIEDIQRWITSALHRKNCKAPMLLINGPSGSGKTITVQVICKELGLDIFEWVTPKDVEYQFENDYQNYSITPKQGELFQEFLHQSQFTSLFNQMSSEIKQIILVEDYPNVFIRNPVEFHNKLEYYYQHYKIPIIFICTDTRNKNLNISKNLFPQNILDTCHFETINFNPVSTSLLQKAMKWAINIMNKHPEVYKIVSQDCIDAIINTSNGDIRNAITNLHFASLKDTSALSFTKCEDTIDANDRKKTKKKNFKLTNVGQDENLNLMHGIGRVLYPKKNQNLQNGIRFLHNPDNIVDNFSSMPSLFISFLHENYFTHFSNIDDVSKASDLLSESDVLLNNWKEKDVSDLYAMSVAVRGLMITNSAPKSGWNLIRGPKYVVNRRIQERNVLCPEWCLYSDLILDYLPYSKIIKSTH